MTCTFLLDHGYVGLVGRVDGDWLSWRDYTASLLQDEYCDAKTLENRLHAMAKQAMNNPAAQARRQAMQQQRAQANGLVSSPVATGTSSQPQASPSVTQQARRKLEDVGRGTLYTAPFTATERRCSRWCDCQDRRQCRRTAGQRRASRGQRRGALHKGDGWRTTTHMR